MNRKPNSPKHGFTLVELLIVVALVAIIAVIGYMNLSGTRRGADVKNAARDMTALLREAQSRSSAQVQGAAWGVHFENSTATAPFYSIFYGAYSAGTRTGYYRLPGGVQYVSATLGAGSSTEIVFYQITGLPSSTLSLNLLGVGGVGVNATITVATSGLVSYQ